MTKIIDFFEGLKESLYIGLMIFIIVFFIVLIIVEMGLFIKLTKKTTKDVAKNAVVSIISSTIIACIFMIPISNAFYGLVKMNVKKNLKNEAEKELKQIQLEVKNKQLQKENLEQQTKLMENELKMNSLDKQIQLLKASQVSAMQFKKINEVALLETNIEQTKIWYEDLKDKPEIGWGINADYYTDTALVVNTYDIDAKFGIDLNAIKIKKIDDNTIQIANVTPKYIGSPRNEKNQIIKEIRRENYKKSNNIPVLVSASIQNDKTNKSLADNIEQYCDQEYQTSLRNMENWSFLKDAIVSSGKNFLKVIFAPVYENIEFVEDEPAKSDEFFLPMYDYLENEIKNNEENSQELENAIEKLNPAENIQIDSNELLENSPKSDLKNNSKIMPEESSSVEKIIKFISARDINSAEKFFRQENFKNLCGENLYVYFENFFLT